MNEELAILQEKQRIDAINRNIEGIAPGKIFYVRVADGKSYYKIIKVGRKKSRVQIVDSILNPDKYICPVIGIKGNIDNCYLSVFFNTHKNNSLRIEINNGKSNK